MASSSSSPHPKTPVNSHPLSAEDVTSSSRGRRPRGKEFLSSNSSGKPGSSAYLTVAGHSISQGRDGSGNHSLNSVTQTGNWDGSVRGYGKDKSLDRRNLSNSLSGLWDNYSLRAPPTFILGPPSDPSLTPRDSPSWRTTKLPLYGEERHETSPSVQVLTHQWHTYSDDVIQAKLSMIDDPSSSSSQPHHTTIRVLSSALSNLTRACHELEEAHRLLQEKEVARKRRAEELMKELKLPSERDVAKRVVQSIFTDDDESVHQVQRRQSQMVFISCIHYSSVLLTGSQSLHESLSEAISDEVPISRSIPEAAPIYEAELSVTEDDRAPSHGGAKDPIILPHALSRDADASSITSVLSERSSHSQAPSIGDWMGTWWRKGNRKNVRPSPNPIVAQNDDVDDAAEVSVQELLRASKIAANGHPADPNTPRATERPQRKSGKDAFGTFGTSILNPSMMVKKRPVPSSSSASISDVPVNLPGDAQHSTKGESQIVDMPAPSSVQATPSIPRTPGVAAPADPQLTYVENIPSSSSSELPSIPPLPENPPPQGATLRAIVNATRVMTQDPASILADAGADTSDLVKQLAMELIKNARDEGLTFREQRPKNRAGKGRVERAEFIAGGTMANVPRTTFGATGEAIQTLNRTLASQEGIPNKSKTRTAASLMATPFSSPLFGSFLPQQRKPSNTADISQKAGTGPDQPSSNNTSTLPQARPGAGSVPLDAIIPDTAKPPTQYLSRTYTPLTARDFQFSIPLPNAASRFSASRRDDGQPPLTDRYGFIYDVSQYDVLLLRRAKECGNTAPACLTGVKIADRQENNSWPEEDEEVDSVAIIKHACDCDGMMTNSLTSSMSILAESPTEDLSQQSRGVSPSSSKSGKRRSITTTPSAAVMNSSFNVPSHSSTSILSVTSDTPRHACANTIRRMLDELTEIHDQRQELQRKEWDAFVRQRSKVKPVKSGSGAVSSGGGGAAAILGLSKTLDEEELSHSDGIVAFAQLSNGSDRRGFDKLVRNGIPLVYRAKVWFECSGALEMKEPGLFHDLLAQVDRDDDGSKHVLAEIEKDVGRTMPLNIFFGGDGAGVLKLRRVLTAYSRCVLILFMSISSYAHIINLIQTQPCCRVLPGHESSYLYASTGSR